MEAAVVAPELWSDDQPTISHPAPVRSQRELGAFYTHSQAASFMARWAIRHDGERVLEPSMGDGQFIRAVQTQAERSKFRNLETWGVELDQETFRQTVGGGLVQPSRAILGDFLEVEPFGVDVVIGNPPYVRLRHLPPEESERGRRVASRGLGVPVDPAGSVWLPFVVHGAEFLSNGGRLAFVLPYDFTYVRYAKPLWRFLGESFGSLQVVRVRERLFPDILQDVVILLADTHGSTTSTVQFDCYEHRIDLLDGAPSSSTEFDLERVTGDGRPFMEALLPRDLRELLSGKIQEISRPSRDVVTWNIGYVSGDKGFFHPTKESVSAFELPDRSLIPVIASGRRATGHGLGTAGIPANATQRLFLPSTRPSELSPGERRYVDWGAAEGIDTRYKCRIRDPWYVTPGVRTPDVIMPVFADLPVLLVNDGRLGVSNSILAGYSIQMPGTSLAASWYTSLTLLQIELVVHSLGGGVLVMVPKEAGAIRVATAGSIEALADIDIALRSGSREQAYERGDVPTLIGLHGLTRSEIQMVQAGVEVLRTWRKSSVSSTP